MANPDNQPSRSYNDSRSDSLSPNLRLLRFLCGVGSVGLVLAVVCLIVLRLTTQFDNEWVESSIVQSAMRVLRGQPLYLAPSVEYVPDNYPPLYFYISAGFMGLFGPSVLVCRALSLAAMVAIAWAIYWLPGLPTEDRRLRWLGVVLFVAFYAVGEKFYDLARVDMVAIAFLTWGAALLIRSWSRRSVVFAGLLMAAAILTKHNAVIVAFFLGLGLLFFDRRKALLFGVLSGGIPLAVFGALHLRSAGWSTFYLFTQPSMHPFGDSIRWTKFVAHDFGYHGVIFSAAIIGGAIILSKAMRQGQVSRDTVRPLVLLLLAICGGIVMTLVGRLKAGGSANNLIPAWTFAVMTFAWILPRLRTYLVSSGAKAMRTFEWTVWSTFAVVMCLLALRFGKTSLLQIAHSAERRDAINRLRDTLQRKPWGPVVWMPAHNIYVDMERPFAHACPIEFLMNSPSFPAKSMLEADMARHLEARTWNAILLDEPEKPFDADRCQALLKANYHEVPWPLPHPERCGMLCGKGSHPQRLYVSNNAASAPAVRH